MRAITPAPLKIGDKVTIVATARSINKDLLLQAARYLEEFGLEVNFGNHAFAVERQFAGSDAQRLQDLNNAIADKECRAIICARGGYGSVRLLGGMDLQNLAKDRKWIVGYSDITALLHHVYQSIGLCGIHGSMPVDFNSLGDNGLSTLKNCLFGESVQYELNHHSLNRRGTGEGELIGGNLSVIYSLLGSVSQISTEGKVLFLEDLDEYLYHIDRMMIALKRAGMLHGLAGLVVGGFTKMNDNIVPFGKTGEEIVREAVEEYDFPVCFDFPAGHIPDNRAWVHGAKVQIAVDEDGSVIS